MSSPESGLPYLAVVLTTKGKEVGRGGSGFRRIDGENPWPTELSPPLTAGLSRLRSVRCSPIIGESEMGG